MSVSEGLDDFLDAALGVVDYNANRLLSAMEADDLALLIPHLRLVRLAACQQLEFRDRKIDQVYFVGCGIVSVVATSRSEVVEIGICGYEGMTGTPILLGSDRSPNEAFVQIPGYAWALASDVLGDALLESSTLRRFLLRYVQAFNIQMAGSALAFGRYKIEARLARWLLMAMDRVKGREIALTHDLLALMLGVRRAGVTGALATLGRSGFLDNRRGKIIVTDRNGLIQAAKGSYGIPEDEYERLIFDSRRGEGKLRYFVHGTCRLRV